MGVLNKETEALSHVEPSRDQHKRNTTTCAHIGPDVTWKGIIVCTGTIQISGKLEGEVRTTGSVIVGPHGFVDGRITAESLFCQGKIKGHVSAKRSVELGASAIVLGSVTTPVLIIEDGGVLIADVEMRKAPAPAIWQEAGSPS